MAAADKARTETDLLSRLGVGSKLVRAQTVRDLAKTVFSQTNNIQALTPDVKPDLATQFGVNRAGQQVSQTAHQIHQRLVNTIESTIHTFSPFFDSLPGATVFTSDAPVTAVIREESFANFPIGTEIIAIQAGEGAVTLAPAAGVSLIPASVVSAGKGALVRLFKYASNAWVGTGNVATGTAHFLASSTSGSSNITGNGAAPKVNFASEQYDPGNSYNPATSEYTVPALRPYFFNAVVRMTGMTVAATKAQMSFVPSSGLTAFNTWTGNGLIGTDTSFQHSAIMNLAAGTTVHVTMQIDGEAGDICDVVGAGGALITFFSGFGVG